jgi:perosamine synthetase
VSTATSTASFIPLSVPHIQGNEWAYIKECLDTNWVSSVGAYVDRLEQMMATYVGTTYAVATVNGTAALHIALLVAGIQSDEEVLMPTLTFIAPANAVRYVGAWPVFLDVEPAYWQLDAARMEEFLTEECTHTDGVVRNKTTGRRVRAVIPIDIMGHPCDMDAIVALARAYGLCVIQDATESLGATYRGQRIGAQADIACFSFNGNKIVTAGGGGMIVTNNARWAERAKHLTTQAKDDPVEYMYSEIGYNYRLTNLQAAMGCAQLEQLDAAIDAKRCIARTYTEAFARATHVTTMPEATWAESIYWIYTILLDAQCPIGVREMIAALRARQIEARPLWQPLHQSPAHTASPAMSCPAGERLADQAMSLPSSVGLTETDQARVIDAVQELLRG